MKNLFRVIGPFLLVFLIYSCSKDMVEQIHNSFGKQEENKSPPINYKFTK